MTALRIPVCAVVALSADGTRLAYTANQRLYLRPLDQLEPTPIRGTEVALDQAGAARNPFFSPDGRWIGFWQDGQLKKVSITGGAPLMLCPAENPWGVSWTSDNTILYGQSDEGAGTGAAGIWRVSSEGGKPEHVVKVEAGQIAHGPQLLPGGRAILFTLVARRGEWDTAQIVVQSLDSGRRHVVVERGADARYVPTGHLVYALDGTLLAVPFDVTRLAVTGDAVPLVEDVAQLGCHRPLRDLESGRTGVCAEGRNRRTPAATDAGVGRSPRPRGSDQGRAPSQVFLSTTVTRRDPRRA